MVFSCASFSISRARKRFILIFVAVLKMLEDFELELEALDFLAGSGFFEFNKSGLGLLDGGRLA